MSNGMNIVKSITQSNNQWKIIGGAILIICYLIISFNSGFSIFNLFIFFILGAAGFLFLKPRQEHSLTEQKIDETIDENLRPIMDEIKTRCDKQLANEIDQITQPVISSIRSDFIKSLNWLWEDSEKYLVQVDFGINEIRGVIQMLSTICDDSMKVEQKFEAELDTLINTLDSIKSRKEKERDSLEKYLNNKTGELLYGIEDEADIFYDYVQNLLAQQLKNNPQAMDWEEFYNDNQLGEQFVLAIEKAVRGKLANFENSIVDELEEMAADIVGHMQTGALKIMNIFKNIENLISKLVDEYHGDNATALRKLSDSRHRISLLKEQANEIMVTMAWQDILVERRWEETQEKLFLVKDRVMENVSQDVIEYLKNSLDDEISGYRVMADNPANALVYKAVLDGEIIYQVFVGGNLLDVIGDGVNVLLQFIRPVELMVNRTVYLNEVLINKRRIIKDQIGQAQLQEAWDRLIGILKANNEELPAYLKGIYPLGFAAFCKSPYIHYKPDNLNQAGWMLYLVLINKQIEEDELYILASMLLIMHQFRNKYIHPLKSKPLPLQDLNEIGHIRYCAWHCIDMLNKIDMKTLLKARRRVEIS
ncbi:MAG: hypothetical protein PHF24_05590 [Syntrophomonas sp.]|nr:hypothetical protein [Syntrophomonas sp.]